MISSSKKAVFGLFKKWQGTRIVSFLTKPIGGKVHPGHKLLSNGRQREFSILKGPEGLDYLFDLYNLSVQKKNCKISIDA